MQHNNSQTELNTFSESGHVTKIAWAVSTADQIPLYVPPTHLHAFVLINLIIFLLFELSFLTMHFSFKII